jgi:HEAT repeat protein
MTDDSGKSIEQLVEALGDKNATKRLKAREALVDAGSEAVPFLLSALDSLRQHVRWEAAKALTAIGDPRAADSLVAALSDKDPDVRWVVGEALIALGRDALKPLLVMLEQSDVPDSAYRGAHHVLHDLVRRSDLNVLLRPVLQAFDEPEPTVAVPVAAAEALHSGKL